MRKDYLNLSSDFWRKNPICVDCFKVHLIWFDSMGAKSSCILVETPDVKMLVDPGAAAMQPSYPLSDREKSKFRKFALRCIKEASKQVDTIFISHYHYDHHTPPPEAGRIYSGKTLWIKNPNLWINQSQKKRAHIFLKQLLGSRFRDVLSTSNFSFDIQDPLRSLPLAREKDYGSYQERKNELLRKRKIWMEELIGKWRKGPWIDERGLKKHRIFLADAKTFQAGPTRVRFTSPLFHGVEYDRLGWVIAMVIERGRTKFVYTSDLQGPVIEDYASWIAKEEPSILILDGPATYLLGYMLNSINLERCINNLHYILENTSPQIIIYDHHLLRDRKYRQRVARVYNYAREKNKKILTAAQWHKKQPLVLTVR